MGLLNEKIMPLDYASSALANYRPAQPDQSNDQGLADRILPFIPGIGAFYLAGKEYNAAKQRQGQALRDTQGMNYRQLAEYWAQQGDPQKAQQYAELAGAGRNEVYGQTVELDDGNIYQLTKSGQPQLLGKAPPKPARFQGGYQVDQAGNPIAELPMTSRDRAAEARANAQLELSRASADRAAEAAAISRQGLSNQQTEREDKKRMEVRKAEAPIKVLDQKLDQLDKVLEGSTRLDLINPLSDKNAQLKSIISQIQLSYKDVAGLGALVGADFNILDGVIQRPENLTTLAGGSKRYKEQIKAMKQELELARQGVRDMYGERTTFKQEKPKFDQASYNDYKSARAQAYAAGKYDLVRKMDQEAVADGLILAVPRSK